MRFRELFTRIGIWPQIAFLDEVRVPIRRSALSSKMRRHLMRGGYERAERKILSRLIREGDAVIELGASLGIVTTLLARKVGSSGQVVAVEPNRLLRPHFDRQLACNKKSAILVEALGCPVWGGSVPEKIRSQCFTAAENSLSGRAEGNSGAEVPWLTLKEIAARAGIEAPTAVVIDVEGGEQVWCDLAPSFPNSVKTIIVEVHPHLIGGDKAARCVQALVREGFELAEFTGSVFGLSR